MVQTMVPQGVTEVATITDTIDMPKVMAEIEAGTEAGRDEENIIETTLITCIRLTSNMSILM